MSAAEKKQISPYRAGVSNPLGKVLDLRARLRLIKNAPHQPKEEQENTTQIDPWFVLRNRQDEVVLCADIASHRSGFPSETEILRLLSVLGESARWLLFADLSEIRLYQRELSSVVLVHTFETKEILRAYDPGVDAPFVRYLATLTEAWCADLIYHWKSQEPPNQEALSDEFIEAIQGCATEWLQ
jgi:hypothetical protein